MHKPASPPSWPGLLGYFSIDNGQRYYYYRNRGPLEPDQDFGDWIQAAPGGTPPGPDAFDLHENPGVISEMSAFDLVNMNVLGWNLVPVVRPNPPPAATTADMVLRRADGFYEIYDIGKRKMARSRSTISRTIRSPALRSWAPSG
jgi:hypothetical protein